MKKLSIAILIVSFQALFSQHPFSGVVEYTIESSRPIDSIKLSLQKIDKLSKDDKAKMIKDFTTSAFFTLEFKEHESSYRNKKEMKDDDEKNNKSNFLQILGGGLNCDYYFNSIERTTVAKKFAFGENFIITYNLREWEITNESKKIGNYTCYKAYEKTKTGTSNENVIIWYTPEIPNQFGPERYVGLPGMVLEVIIGKIRIIATKINFTADENQFSIEKPTKGLKLSEDEYKKKVTEMSEKLGF
jgi:GLPGLI family protein